LFLLAYNVLHSYGQLPGKRNDPLLQTQIRRMELADNQFFNIENKDFIVLFTVVPDQALKNKDSLKEASENLYFKVLKAIGRGRLNEPIDIAFLGQQSDRDNLSFGYRNNEFTSMVKYGLNPDTLLARDNNVSQRLFRLSSNKFVRHRLTSAGLSIVFS